MRFFCFRFDVDTVPCVSRGVPNLIDLADSLGVKFTFFFNMGRATSRKDYLRKLWQKMRKSDNIQLSKLSSLHKLGLLHFLITAIRNPYVGKAYPVVVQLANRKGHEVGLHGGRSHGEWQNNAKNWSEVHFRKEVEYGLTMLRRIGIEHITSFSSPGWQGPNSLHSVLSSLDFRIVADIHGNDLDEINWVGPDKNLIAIPTNIAGEPGGVGYIEHLRAQGLDDNHIIIHFQHALSRRKKFVVVYDHPYYAGIQELPIVEKMIRIAHDMGLRVVTLREMASALLGEKQ